MKVKGPLKSKPFYNSTTLSSRKGGGIIKEEGGSKADLATKSLQVTALGDQIFYFVMPSIILKEE